MKLGQALVLIGLSALISFQVESSSAAIVGPAKDGIDTITGNDPVPETRHKEVLDDLEENLRGVVSKINLLPDPFELLNGVSDIRNYAEGICKKTSGAIRARAVVLYKKADEIWWKIVGHNYVVKEPDC